MHEFGCLDVGKGGTFFADMDVESFWLNDVLGERWCEFKTG